MTEFEAFVAHVFDHPVVRPEWYWSLDAEEWPDPPERIGEYCTRLFEDADVLLQRFSDAQVNQGLWYLAGPGSDAIRDIMDAASQGCRSQFVASISSLYRKCFANRCTSHLSHLGEAGASCLNSVCYMWWDLFPSWGDGTGSSIDRQILDVMRQSLALNSIACQESALHGVGHWHPNYSGMVEEIVREFLERHRDLRPELIRYAQAAGRGGVQ